MKKPDNRHRRLLSAHGERPCGCAAEKRDELSPSHDEEFPSRAGLISSRFALETSILARGRAGLNRAVLTTAGWSAHSTQETVSPPAGGSAY
jgi:hypothetical protein